MLTEKKKISDQFNFLRDSLVAQMLKNLPAMQETWVQSLGQEDPLRKEMATHSTFYLFFSTSLFKHKSKNIVSYIIFQILSYISSLNFSIILEIGIIITWGNQDTERLSDSLKVTPVVPSKAQFWTYQFACIIIAKNHYTIMKSLLIIKI